jgi:hypothetical protein
MLFGSYRRGDANDPDTYVAAIAAVLSLYDVELIREVTDPRFGIMTSEKHMTFMPNAGELRVYCEALAARRERMRRLADLPAPNFQQARLEAPEPSPGHFANAHVMATHPRYASLCEWTKTAEPKLWKFGKSSTGVDGIWIPYNVWDDGPSAVKKSGEFATMTVEQLRGYYAKAKEPAE